MSACCDDNSVCCDPAVTNTPGAQGAAGEAGTNGAAGVSSFALVATYDPPPQPAMPTSGNDVDVEYTTSIEAFAVNAIVYQQGWGWMRVMAQVDNVTLTLRNPETATDYTDNAVAGTLLAATSRLMPSGPQGPPGTNGTSGAPVDATYITQVLNGSLPNEQALSVLASGILRNTTVTGVLSIDALITAIAALAPTVADRFVYTTGVNTVALGTITAFIRTLLDDANQAAAQTTLGVTPGTNVQAFNALLAAVAALAPTVADRYIYTTGVNTVADGIITATSRALLANASIQTWNFALGGLIPRYGRLGSINTGNMNSTADITLAVDAYVSNARYRIDKIMVENASISLTTATAGVFTAAGGGGTTVAAAQALSALTASNKWLALTLEAVTGTDVFTASPLYFRVVTPQGAAATANVHLFGWSFDGP